MTLMCIPSVPPNPFENGSKRKKKAQVESEKQAEQAEQTMQWEIFGKTRAEFLFFCCQKAKSKAGILRFQHFLCLPVIFHRWFWFRAEMSHPLEGMKPGKRAQASRSHAKVYRAAGEQNESREKLLRKPPIRVQKWNRPVTVQCWNPHFPLDYVV